MRNILTADIGGTHSRFGFFTLESEGRLSLAEALWFTTVDSRSFAELMDNLKKSDSPFRPADADMVVLAVAGPIEEKVRSMPPLISWGIDISHAEEDFGFKRCVLINDFIAQAYSCHSPVGKEALKILAGTPAADAATAVIGAGTGLGKAFTMPDGRGGYVAMPSEGGHTNFPFVSAEEFAYQDFLLKERDDQYITCNTVVSGKGLSYLHQFLTGRKREPFEVAREFPRSPRTLEWAARFYARACRNYALETLAMGGLYIAGGVAARSPELVTHPTFEEEFRSSDTHARLLAKIPVSLISDENSGLWGGAILARQKLGGVSAE
jgi:glucokinase